ncbi:hypothetical protein KDA11_05105 [Candidatus Saccharibacteria bacterium]|nr:hypothetical protein [Candidatus Saccharibacteria bacterium]
MSTFLLCGTSSSTPSGTPCAAFATLGEAEALRDSYITSSQAAAEAIYGAENVRVATSDDTFSKYVIAKISKTRTITPGIDLVSTTESTYANYMVHELVNPA